MLDSMTGLMLMMLLVVCKNSSPRPDGKRVGAQAAALRIGGDASVFYNCKFYGYQDTIFDYKGRHLFKDCYIEGTVDFIFGSAKSVYLVKTLHNLLLCMYKL